MVAIMVILAATISVFALVFTDDANQSDPVVGQSSGELVPQDGFDRGIVHINPPPVIIWVFLSWKLLRTRLASGEETGSASKSS